MTSKFAQVEVNLIVYIIHLFYSKIQHILFMVSLFGSGQELTTNELRLFVI